MHLDFSIPRKYLFWGAALVNKVDGFFDGREKEIRRTEKNRSENDRCKRKKWFHQIYWNVEQTEGKEEKHENKKKTLSKLQ